MPISDSKFNHIRKNVFFFNVKNERIQVTLYSKFNEILTNTMWLEKLPFSQHLHFLGFGFSVFYLSNQKQKY